MIFRPHWLKPFSNWSKYNVKPSLNTKWRQISIECLHFFKERFPRICLNKVLIVSAQHFISSIPDYRRINSKRFPHFSIIVPILYGENFGVQPVEMAVAFFCVFGCSRGLPDTMDALLLVLFWSTNDFLFFFTIIYWPTLNILIRTLQGSHLVLTYLCFYIIFTKFLQVFTNFRGKISQRMQVEVSCVNTGVTVNKYSPKKSTPQ